MFSHHDQVWISISACNWQYDICWEMTVLSSSSPSPNLSSIISVSNVFPAYIWLSPNPLLASLPIIVWLFAMVCGCASTQAPNSCTMSPNTFCFKITFCSPLTCMHTRIRAYNFISRHPRKVRWNQALTMLHKAPAWYINHLFACGCKKLKCYSSGREEEARNSSVL